MTSQKPSRQTDVIPDHRAAVAPYNFVPLPIKVVLAEQQPVDQSTYHADRQTGRIECSLTTASPLYVRCGYTPEEYADLAEKPFDELTEEQQRNRAQFFHLGDPDAPAIPGSSLRGMVRALVEIAGYGKMEKVTDRPRFFFRAVAAPTDDPLKFPYENIIGRFGSNVRAGYLEREGERWYIRPARKIGSAAFVKIKEWDKKSRRELIPRSLPFTRLNENGYRPQYVPCSFTTRPGKMGVQIDQIGPLNAVPGGQAGWLVTSGNMLETADLARGTRSPRTSHTVIAQAVEATRLAIDAQAIEDYRAGLTDYQKEPPFDPHWGALIEGRPIFYCEPLRNQDVRYFGHNPNFRIPFIPPDGKRAATPSDLVPASLRDDSQIDLAEAIFGFVRGKKQRQGLSAVAGRVFFSDAQLVPGQGDVLSATPITPRILGGPKPTTFQHYLVQPSEEKRNLQHYASDDATIRGHKLYWHKGPDEQTAANPDVVMSPEDQQKPNESQRTAIRPVQPGISFTFTIHFENLSKVELGALLWVLRLAADEQYRLKLGMGKPLGMGAVRIESRLVLSRREERYMALFNGDDWARGDQPALTLDEFEAQQQCISAFEGHVLQESDDPSSNGTLAGTLRMQCLLALLRWPGPPHETTRYMEIERSQLPRLGNDQNEYKARRVLPDPRQVGRGINPYVEQRDWTPQSHQGQPPIVVQPKPPAVPQLPEIGVPFNAEVLAVEEQAVFVQVPDFDEAKVLGVIKAEAISDGRTARYRVGNRARVEAIGMRQLKSGKTIVDLKPAPKQ